MKPQKVPRLPQGTYVVAVSGGVDSMTLLDVLARQAGLSLIVAHFDHGIREDSHEDEKLVCQAAAKYDLPYIYDKVALGVGASEAEARRARYGFLRGKAKELGAKIVTAHHEDDVLETAILNLLRGTGRRGLSSLQSTEEIVRPFLDVPKKEIIAYARAQNLLWREDSTNAEEKYLRNYLRKRIVPRFGEDGRSKLLENIRAARKGNAEIETILAEVLAVQSKVTLQRSWFAALPYDVSLEVLAAFLRQNGIAFDAKTLHRLTVAAKTLTPGKRAAVNAGWYLLAEKTAVKLTTSLASQNSCFGV